MVAYDSKMGFVVLAIIVTFAVSFAVILPLVLRTRDVSEKPEARGGDVYRDQLRELERDRSDGRIDDASFQAARAEIARRLIASEKDRPQSAGGLLRDPADQHLNTVRARWLTAGTIVLVFIVAGIAYPLIGSPLARDQPLSQRIDSDNPDLPVLISRVERHLAENPDDGRGWQLLAPIYARQMRLEAARNAYVNALRILGPDADLLVGLGEVIVTESSGIVTDEALEVFRRADALDPPDPRAAYYIALAAEQSGQYAEALERFKALRAQAPVDAPWIETVNLHIERNQARLVEDGRPATGPDAEAVENAQSLSQSERDDMIRGMVDGLAARLAENPNDLEGWMQLIRSYAVLGQEQKANDALEEAMQVFQNDSEAISRLSGFAGQLGISGEQP